MSAIADSAGPALRAAALVFGLVMGLAAAASPVRVADGAAGAAPSPPSPPTAARLPTARTLIYGLRIGPASGTGTLQWTHGSGRYQAVLEGRVAGLSILQWTSVGSTTVAGLAPDRFTDRRIGGREHTVRFVRPEGLLKSAGDTADRPFPPDAQDRLSWMIQIAAIAQGLGRPLVDGERITMWVADARGHGQLWAFRAQGRELVGAAAGPPIPSVRLVREPPQAQDTRVEVWLDPERDHLPVRAVIQPAGGDSRLELSLRP